MNKTPVPKMEAHREVWRIYWYFRRKKHSFVVRCDQSHAQIMRAEIERALILQDQALRRGVCDCQTIWPEWAISHPSVKKYIEARASVAGVVFSFDAANPVQTDAAQILEQYLASMLSRDLSPRWSQQVNGYLGELIAWMEQNGITDFAAMTGQDANEFLSFIRTGHSPTIRRPCKARSAPTRNRVRAACSGLYSWLGAGNPFSQTRPAKEYHSDDIVYYRVDERDALLDAMAEDPFVVPLWIAFYAGLRRSEILRLQWDDVHLDTGLIRVRGRTKTARARGVPIARPLQTVLEEASARGQEIVSADYPSSAAQYFLRRVGKADACPSTAHAGWNAFRHTFASLLVQAGVSLDKVSAWMGNTPEVCRRHYAQFIPRDQRDSDIDRLG